MGKVNGVAVYVISSTSGHYKIGISDDPYLRFQQLRKTKGPYEYRLEFYWVLKNRETATITEKWIHDSNREKRVNGEWFVFTPRDLLEMYQSIEYGKTLYEMKLKKQGKHNG